MIFYLYAGTALSLLTGEIIDVSSPYNATLDCIFLSGFTGSARCTVQYGTDPTYMNLPYSAESTETGTAGDTVSVVLRERLNSSTVYYYNVSAVSGDITVTVRGNFTTPQYCKQRHLYGFFQMPKFYCFMHYVCMCIIMYNCPYTISGAFQIIVGS